MDYITTSRISSSRCPCNLVIYILFVESKSKHGTPATFQQNPITNKASHQQMLIVIPPLEPTRHLLGTLLYLTLGQKTNRNILLLVPTRRLLGTLLYLILGQKTNKNIHLLPSLMRMQIQIPCTINHLVRQSPIQCMKKYRINLVIFPVDYFKRFS